jgi:nitroreductase
MVLFSNPIAKIIKRRYSCRGFAPRPIEKALRDQISGLLSESTTGPLGTEVRFELISADEHDLAALKGLGTYGFIKGARGFIIGAAKPGRNNLEDYGYLMEQAVLLATDLGLGTCWLGGTFKKSNFARKISLDEDETMPAVVAVGYAADKRRWLDSYVRRLAASDSRLPWASLFFNGGFLTPLTADMSGVFAPPLGMVRLGPSASNRQPWRIVKDGSLWHFYLQRTSGYAERNKSFLKLADLQRVDMGIAMCHFELAAQEKGLSGEWTHSEQNIQKHDVLTEYIITWQQKDLGVKSRS